MDHFPVYFSYEQLKILMFSNLGREAFRVRRSFEEELEILEREIHKKELDMDEYLKYRLFTFGKYINITGTNYIIPFVDFLDTNPVNFNLKVKYFNENNTICIIAANDINPQDELKLFVVPMTNSNSLSDLWAAYFFPASNGPGPPRPRPRQAMACGLTA